MHAEDAPVALGIELEVENVEIALNDGDKEAIVTQHPLDVSKFRVEVQSWAGKHVLRFVRGFIDSDDRSLHGIDIQNNAPNDQGRGRETLAHKQKIGGQLDAVVGAVLPARLSLDDPQARHAVVPEQYDEVHPALEIEASDPPGHLDFSAVERHARDCDRDGSLERRPRHDIGLRMGRCAERTHPLRRERALPGMLGFLADRLEYRVQAVEQTLGEGNSPGKSSIGEPELEAPLA